MRLILSAVALVVCVGLVSAREDKKVDEKKLLGKWEPAKADPNTPKMVIEFAEKGKLVLTVTVGDKTEKIEGTYKVDGNKVSVAMTFGGQEQKETFTVTKQTDDEITSKDTKGKEETLKRVKAK